MSQSRSVTVSPSSLRITRSTPWVDGCCGPILSTISSVSKRVSCAFVAGCSCISSWGMGAGTQPLTPNTYPLSSFRVLHINQARVVIDLAIVEMLIGPLVVSILDRIFFSKRKPRPIGWKQYPPKVRVSFKPDSKHVEDFAFHPVCARPDMSDTWTNFAVGQ